MLIRRNPSETVWFLFLLIAAVLAFVLYGYIIGHDLAVKPEEKRFHRFIKSLFLPLLASPDCGRTGTAGRTTRHSACSLIMEQHAILQVHNEIFELFNDLEIDELVKRSKKGLKLAWPEVQKAVQKRLEKEAQKKEKAALKAV